MTNAMIINTFSSDNTNIARIKTLHCQIKTIITNKTVKFKPIIKKPVVTENTFFTLYCYYF